MNAALIYLAVRGPDVRPEFLHPAGEWVAGEYGPAIRFTRPLDAINAGAERVITLRALEEHAHWFQITPELKACLTQKGWSFEILTQNSPAQLSTHGALEHFDARVSTLSWQARTFISKWIAGEGEDLTIYDLGAILYGGDRVER